MVALSAFSFFGLYPKDFCCQLPRFIWLYWSLSTYPFKKDFNYKIVIEFQQTGSCAKYVTNVFICQVLLITSATKKSPNTPNKRLRNVQNIPFIYNNNQILRTLGSSWNRIWSRNMITCIHLQREGSCKGLHNLGNLEMSAT